LEFLKVISSSFDSNKTFSFLIAVFGIDCYNCRGLDQEKCRRASKLREMVRVEFEN
jgi:hypothetical protein